MKYVGTLLIALIMLAQNSHAQDKSDEENSSLIQFSGLVMTSDSLMTIPYVNIFSKTSRRGSFSDLNGYFNFVAEKGDTIMFTCIGYKSSYYVIPDSLTSNRYSMVKLMTSDTVYLDEAVVRALPLRDMFDYVFVHAEIPDDDMERASCGMYHKSKKYGGAVMKKRGGTFKGTF